MTIQGVRTHSGKVLNRYNFTEMVRMHQLNSKMGYFDKVESWPIWQRAVDYVADSINIDGHMGEDFDVWALGIILWYLLCGYLVLTTSEDHNKWCYNNISVGPKSSMDLRKGWTQWVAHTQERNGTH